MRLHVCLRRQWKKLIEKGARSCLAGRVAGSNCSMKIETHIEIQTQQNIDAGMSRDPAGRRQTEIRQCAGGRRAIPQRVGEHCGSRICCATSATHCAVCAGSPDTRPRLVCTLTLGLGCVTAMLAIVQSVLLLPVVSRTLKNLCRFTRTT